MNITAAEFRNLPKPTKGGRYKRSPKEARTVGGIVFDSSIEAQRWVVLKLLERKGEISDLRRQQSYLIEIKGLLSIALLRFGAGSRESYHSHAFNSTSWLLRGRLREEFHPGCGLDPVEYRPSLWPISTYRGTFHRVFSTATSWVLTFRGPWSRTWREHDPRTGESTTLTHGRKVVARHV